MADSTQPKAASTFPNPFLAGVIAFVVIGGVLIFISGNQSAALISQGLIATVILLILFFDASQIEAGRAKLFHIIGAE